MEYSINYLGDTYYLPAYTFSIADKIEKQEQLNTGNSRFRDKCKGMYDLICELIGDDIKSVIGDFQSTDPNVLNIIYLSIVRAYNKPVSDFNQEEASIALNNEQLDKIMQVLSAMDKAKNLKVIK